MNPEKVGLLIRKIRKENHLTQQDFAKLFGVTYQAVSKWENGKNIPDIAILTDICNYYHYDIHQFLNGKTQKNVKDRKWIFGGIFVLFLLILVFFFLFKRDTFQFKTLSSNCGSFEITGSMAYNNSKTSIYISNVSYCGKEDATKYQKINCSLYEQNDLSKVKIEDCPSTTQETTLEEYLKNVKFQVDDYIKTCKSYKTNTLHLEIEAFAKDGKLTTYQIPLKLEDNCS